MQVSIRFSMYWFRISSSGDHIAPASGFPSRSDRWHQLRRLVAMAIQNDRRRSVGSVSVTFCLPLICRICVCVCVCVCVCARVCARMHMFVGDHAFCMMDSHGQESNPLVIMGALDLVVWVCAQGDCRRCIFTLHCGHDHCGVIISIHVS